MSIDEVIEDALFDYCKARCDRSYVIQDRIELGLRSAIKQHVAEAVAREREECAKMADEYATWGGSNFYDWFARLAAAIRARGTT